MFLQVGLKLSYICQSQSLRAAVRCSSSSSSSSAVERLQAVMSDLASKIETGSSSSITQEKAAYSVCQLYSQLSSGQKREFLCRLSETNKVRTESVRSAAENILSAEEVGIKIQEEMIASLSPAHHQTFTKIGQIKGGVKFLVDLRRDLLNALRASDPRSSECHALKTMNGNLRSLLSHWFSVGFLSLHRVLGCRA